MAINVVHGKRSLACMLLPCDVLQLVLMFYCLFAAHKRNYSQAYTHQAKNGSAFAAGSSNGEQRCCVDGGSLQETAA
jgi:hypothetical protein